MKLTEQEREAREKLKRHRPGGAPRATDPWKLSINEKLIKADVYRSAAELGHLSEEGLEYLRNTLEEGINVRGKIPLSDAEQAFKEMDREDLSSHVTGPISDSEARVAWEKSLRQPRNGGRHTDLYGKPYRD